MKPPPAVRSPSAKEAVAVAASGPLVLAGDIGATKSDLCLCRETESGLVTVREQKYRNQEWNCLEAIIDDFLSLEPEKPRAACFGVAGPIRDNRVRMTNLGWTLDAVRLQDRFTIRQVALINDLVAMALGTLELPSRDLKPINRGQADPAGAIGVLAPGTGLGEAFILRLPAGPLSDSQAVPPSNSRAVPPSNSRAVPLPCGSEGGHVDFAPRDELQIELLRYLRQRKAHVSVEDVCSGRAIPMLYDFLDSHTGAGERLLSFQDPDLDPTAAIVQAARRSLEGREGGSDLAVRALELFWDILAAEAANLTLKVLCWGGIYIGGGMPPRILPFLKPDRFLDRFARGVYRDLLTAVPIHVILNPKTGLLGAASRARALLREKSS
ncbi:glucokinase [Desulfolithobacter dissulfuricans]|uniref:glucokinase n=1 Tax=Desulfolithobacter dissulfuricans TaxID=2795293 RepID=UPI0022780370|nr:glucokinase [Desulfolithobacter dissulfuricans]